MLLLALITIIYASMAVGLFGEEHAELFGRLHTSLFSETTTIPSTISSLINIPSSLPPCLHLSLPPSFPPSLPDSRSLSRCLSRSLSLALALSLPRSQTHEYTYTAMFQVCTGDGWSSVARIMFPDDPDLPLPPVPTIFFVSVSRACAFGWLDGVAASRAQCVAAKRAWSGECVQFTPARARLFFSPAFRLVSSARMQLERYCLTWWCAPAQYMLLASLVLINIIIAVLLDGASAFENKKSPQAFCESHSTIRRQSPAIARARREGLTKRNFPTQRRDTSISWL